MTPDPNCSNCNGTGKMAAIALDIHGDSQHDCFCTTHDQGPQHPEDMTREEVNTEILEWREGRLYRGYDRYLAEQVPGLKAEIQRLEAEVKRLKEAQEWRPEVKHMADMMEKRLKKNQHRGGWKEQDFDYLVAQIHQNLNDAYWSRHNGTWHAFNSACADIANFAMMLMDNSPLAAYRAQVTKEGL